mgnify:CR=1 FL=1
MAERAPMPNPDWPKLIAELEQKLTAYKIASCLGIQITQLDRIKAGSEPKYGVAVALMGIHEIFCGGRRDEAPLLPRPAPDRG